MTLGNRISQYRKEKGLTQEGLAQALGVTNQAVSKWESDQNCPDVLLLPKIAEFFGISLDALFGRELPAPVEPQPWADAPLGIVKNLPWPDDKTLRVVIYKGHTLLKNTPDLRDVTLHYQGEVLNLDSAISVQCGDVHGNADAGTSICCGNVLGHVDAGTSVSCGNVEGNVDAGTDVKCGNVMGSVDAGCSVECDQVGGDVDAGTDVKCADVTGDVDAGCNVECTAVHGDIDAGGKVVVRNK